MAEAEQDSAQTGNGLTLTEQELFDRLGWFTQIRWIMGVLSLVLLLVSWSLFDIHFSAYHEVGSLAPAAGMVLLIFLYNAAFTFILNIVRTRRQITSRIIVAIAIGQISCDMLAVCGLVHFTGGVENYFLVLVLLPLVIAAELLPPKLAYAMAGVGAVMLNALLWAEQQGWVVHLRAERWSDRIAEPVFGSQYANPLYVLQVSTALTAMMFAMVFIGSAISVRLREREAELEGAYRRLHQIDEAKGFFMRKAGHEMRAPLAAIHSILDAIAHGAPDMPKSHLRLMDRARRRTRALMDLVKDLRRYSWLRSPEGILQMRAVCLEELVENAAELFRQQAEAGEVMVACRTDPVYVDGDEEMLREVVTNLVANAVQYTPAGGRIDIDLKAQAGQAVLAVADTGIGIREELRARLFDEFYRAPEAKRQFPDGTGLGLAITKRIVTMHGGQIDVAARPGGGSIFSVRLPAKPAHNGEQA